MNQMVVAVFDSDSAAFEGLRELRNLHKEGGVSLYASAVIVKDKTGKVSVKQEADKAPLTELLKPDGCRAPPRSSHRAAGARHHQRLARASG